MTQADTPATTSATDFHQWHRFIQDHCYRWQGVLSRYDQQGQVTEVLDSIRHFTVNAEATSINHALHFTNRTNPEKSLIKTWDVEKCRPGITHPVDPKSRAFFTAHGSGIMSRPFDPEDVNYAELYLNHSHYRTSMVIMYYPAAKNFGLAQISLFRETREDDLETAWSLEQAAMVEAIYPSVKLTKTTQFSPVSLAESEITMDAELWSKGDDRQIFFFPDGLALNIPVQLTPDQEHQLVMSWEYEPGKIKRAIAQFPSDHHMPLLFTQIGERVA